MELWIRSQDEERLCKPNNLFIKNHAICCSYNEESNDTDYLGVYSTKERALEVLDEIQNILKPKYILDSSSIKLDGDSWADNGIILQNYNADARIEELSTYVYEMPKE